MPGVSLRRLTPHRLRVHRSDVTAAQPPEEILLGGLSFAHDEVGWFLRIAVGWDPPWFTSRMRAPPMATSSPPSPRDASPAVSDDLRTVPVFIELLQERFDALKPTYFRQPKGSAGPTKTWRAVIPVHRSRVFEGDIIEVLRRDGRISRHGVASLVLTAGPELNFTVVELTSADVEAPVTIDVLGTRVGDPEEVAPALMLPELEAVVLAEVSGDYGVQEASGTQWASGVQDESGARAQASGVAQGDAPSHRITAQEYLEQFGETVAQVAGNEA